MTLSLRTEARDAAVAAALFAWERIMPLYESGSHVEEGPDGPSTEADKLADRLIKEFLQRSYPTDRFGYLTEETRDDRERLARDHVWIVDPIDGTKDFIKKNGNFAIHVGFVERDGDVWRGAAAAVYRPFPGHMYSAATGAGATLQRYENNRPVGDPTPLRVSPRATIAEMTAVMSNSHRSGELDRLMSTFGFKDVISIGSVGIKMGLIAMGDADCYINLARARCKEWDICAPEIILAEAGGRATGVDGSPFTYNKTNVRDTAGILASNGAAHADLVARVAELEAAG